MRSHAADSCPLIPRGAGRNFRNSSPRRHVIARCVDAALTVQLARNFAPDEAGNKSFRGWCRREATDSMSNERSIDPDVVAGNSRWYFDNSNGEVGGAG